MHSGKNSRAGVSADESSARPRLEARFLGGFELFCDGQPVQGLESQSVRALLVYLSCSPGRVFPRDRLAALLWPEEEESNARHNLRQALYNLRQALRRSGLGDETPIQSAQRTVTFERWPDFFLDVHAFEEAVRRGRFPGGIDPSFFARAARTYRGDFLSGFYIRDSPAFEEWMLGEQERLREQAVTVLRSLVAHHASAGSYPIGLRYCRQLLKLEPFSEESHRDLMLLYALSGRRSQALAHYDEMCSIFTRELGVEPLPETVELQRRIQDQDLQPESAGEKAKPAGPLVPMVEREAALEALRLDWKAVLRQAGRVTLVSGEGGSGKTRLIKAFLHEITSGTSTTILQGRSYELAPPSPYQPLAEAFRNALAHEVALSEHLLVAIPRDALVTLSLLLPEILELDPKLARRLERAGEPDPAHLHQAVARLIRALVHRTTKGKELRPLVLFLDDLQHADAATFRLLEALLPEIAARPVWIVGGIRNDHLDEEHPIQRIRAQSRLPGQVSHVSLERLSRRGAGEIAEALVGEEQGPELADFLEEQAAGLPLAATEWINLMWDEGLLVPQQDGLWSLRRQPTTLLEEEAPLSLKALIQRRINHLPASTRRLLSLAAVIGHRFEATVLQQAEYEHDRVVELGIELMIRHWIVRHFPRYWADSRRERDIALWASGARMGTYEFAHQRIRRAIYESLPAGRRKIIHRAVAAALEEMGTGGPDTLAYHRCRAEDWREALDHLLDAADRAQRLHAQETARLYLGEALEARRHLDEGEDGLPSTEDLEARIEALDSTQAQGNAF